MTAVVKDMNRPEKCKGSGRRYMKTEQMESKEEKTTRTTTCMKTEMEENENSLEESDRKKNIPAR